MPSPSRPIPESYWVLPGQFLAGEYPGSTDPERARQRIGAFVEAGFDTFINLTTVHELPSYEPLLAEWGAVHGREIRHLRFPIGDFGLPTVEQMSSILDAIDAATAEGRRVYLHCWGGIGRTGTTVGCYLARHGMTGKQALAQLREWWKTVPKSEHQPHSPETWEQHEFVRNWSG